MWFQLNKNKNHDCTPKNVNAMKTGTHLHSASGWTWAWILWIICPPCGLCAEASTPLFHHRGNLIIYFFLCFFIPSADFNVDFIWDFLQFCLHPFSLPNENMSLLDRMSAEINLVDMKNLEKETFPEGNTFLFKKFWKPILKAVGIGKDLNKYTL